MLEQKLSARKKQADDFQQALAIQLAKLIQEDEVHNDFNMEMSRFIPKLIKERTLDNPEYWSYIQGEVKDLISECLHDTMPKNKFDMGW